jgi:acyl-CoA dehydrogenase
VTATRSDRPYYHWCFNMPSDHSEVELDAVRVGDEAIVDHGIDASVAYAKERRVFGVPLAEHQGIRWQLVELQTDAELIRNTAWQMDQVAGGALTTAKTRFSDRIAMVNRRYRITEGSDELQMRRIAARLFGLGRG